MSIMPSKEQAEAFARWVESKDDGVRMRLGYACGDCDYQTDWGSAMSSHEAMLGHRRRSVRERYEALCERVSWFEEGAACEAAVVEAFELGQEDERSERFDRARESEMMERDCREQTLLPSDILRERHVVDDVDRGIEERERRERERITGEVE